MPRSHTLPTFNRLEPAVVIVLGWVLVLLLLALWSGLVWSGQALLAAMLAHAGTLGVGDWSLPAALTAWLPVPVAEWLAALLENLTPQLQALAGTLPWLSGGVTVLAWVVWSVGALLLLGVGLAVHVAVALWRKSRNSTLPSGVTALR
ncbi:hypothetical protein ASD35_17180 [Pelomonas sp. Root1444]|nr:hypothetical protein ASD35_17180 [Pelomonas sp. Root1444]